MLETLCSSQSDCDDGDVLDQRSGSPEDIPACTSDDSYYVTWTVSIALAVPRVDESEALNVTKKNSSCYHMEYRLLPGNTETTRLDLVVSGPSARIYQEDQVQIVRTWHEGSLTWVGWNRDFGVRVNKKLLIDLLQHNIRIQMWNRLKMMSRRARYESHKASRETKNQPEDTADMSDGIKAMVNKLRSSCERRSEVETDALSLEEVTKSDHTSMEISPVGFLAGETSVTERFPVRSCGAFEVLCSVALDRLLISDQLKAELNPLVITILSATSMPSHPVPLNVLQEKCVPVFCQYKFHNLNTHRTKSHKHDTKIYFRDVYVILVGLMSPEELKDFLSGPPLEIQVHDRDRKPEETPKPPSTWSDNDNKKTADVDPHGVARLDFSELLFGKKSLKFYLPIKSSPPPPRRSRKWAEPMPPGRYIDANAQLKVQVAIAHPLNLQDSCDGPFGRIVYVFDRNNASALTDLRSEIIAINATAFNVHGSLEITQKALTNHSMNFRHSNESRDVDFVTGFHVVDEKIHILVLEGLKDRAVKRLWETVPMKLSGSEEEDVIVLYNSSLAFLKRLYDSLDLGLNPVRLCEPLEIILKEPRVFIRGTVPPLCLQALLRLSQICQVRQLKNVVQSNLFPTADMILSLMKEYGTLEEHQEEQTSRKSTSVQVCMTKRSKLDTHNPEYVKRKQNSQQELLTQSKDFIQDNIKKVQEESELHQKPKDSVLRIEESEPTHNYSIQTFNSSWINKQQLCREMAQFPGRRFTYSQQYLSATVEPTDRTLKTESKSKSKSAVWRTSPNSDEFRVHPQQPDQARVEELRKPWRENVLHANTLKPPLSRERWTWSRRRDDFQIHQKPPAFFSSAPVSIHLGGDLLRQEQLESARAQHQRWRNKLLPPASDGRVEFKVHMAGGKSGRTTSILKDQPMKYSLRTPGMVLQPFPELSTMRLGAVGEERRGVALAPGPCAVCSLSSNNNFIPRHRVALHNKSPNTGFKQQENFLHRRTALPLTDEEKKIFSFQRDERQQPAERSYSFRKTP